MLYARISTLPSRPNQHFSLRVAQTEFHPHGQVDLAILFLDQLFQAELISEASYQVVPR